MAQKASFGKNFTRRLIQWRSAGQSTRAPALRSMGLYSRRCAHASVNRPPTAPAHHTIVTLGPAASDGCCLHLAQVAINYASLSNATYSRSMGLTLLSHQSIALSLRPHTTPLSLSDRPRLTAAVFTWLKLQSTTPPCGMQLIRARWDSLCSHRCAHASVDRPFTAPAHPAVATLGPAAPELLSSLGSSCNQLRLLVECNLYGTLLPPLHTCISRSPTCPPTHEAHTHAHEHTHTHNTCTPVSSPRSLVHPQYRHPQPTHCDLTGRGITCDRLTKCSAPVVRFRV